MKIKIKELNPNPFKKEINQGKFSEENIIKLMANMEKLDLMGSIPIVKRNDKYYLVSHHHRIEALKRKFGKDYEVEVIVHKYDDDQLLRGMVIENLTQRNDEFHEVTDNLSAIETYLNKHKEILIALRESRSASKKDSLGRENKGSLQKDEFKDKAVSNDIAKWLDNNTGDVMSHDKITNCLNIKKNLDPILYKQIVNTQAGTAKVREDALQETQAIYLSRFEDKKEQKDLADALKNSQEQRVRDQGKLIAAYKEATDDVKKKVREGELDLKEVPFENLKENIKKKIEQEKSKDKGKIIVTHYKQYQNEAGNKIGRTNKEILETCIYLNGLDKTGVLLQLDWKTMLKILESGTEHSKNYNKYMEKILSKVK